MYPDWVWLLGMVLFVWLGALSYFTWKNSNFLGALFPKNKKGDILNRFEEIMKMVDKSDHHIQRVSLSRYNPYDETGGDQSFSVALLDNNGTGIVVTSLHARVGTRVFAKPVIKGSSGNNRFSKEEEIVIKKALNE